MAVTIKRALLSCYDKTGLVEFGRELAALGIELVASGGTAEALAKAGLRVTSVEAFAGITEQLDGRVKTLHPKIHAGILARRDDPAHVRAVGADGLLDLVVVNLYPFTQTVQQAGTTLSQAIEQIDIGGVALLRAAAKNFAHVAVVCQPVQYAQVAAALRAGRGQLPDALTRRLATEAFQVTSAYDAAIHAFLGRDGAAGSAAALPETASVTVRRQQALRYGENPHQRGGWYVPADETPWGLGTLRQLQGKELSYNNLLDLDAAVRCLRDFTEPACAIVKHHGPCGIAIGRSSDDAYERAHACDPESAFGGIVGLNRPLDDAALAKRLTETFLEVIVAPAVSEAAAKALSAKKSLRVMTLNWPDSAADGLQWRQLLGSWLLQDPDQGAEPTFQVVTTRQPTAAEREDLLFAWAVCRQLLSNGIAVVKGRATVGLGQGQPSRVGSVRLAVRHAGDRARQAVAASDGFFPFPDNIELLAQAGITAVIQPGGSVKDAEVIAAADRAGMTMVLTGVRHFRH